MISCPQLNRQAVGEFGANQGRDARDTLEA